MNSILNGMQRIRTAKLIGDRKELNGFRQMTRLVSVKLTISQVEGIHENYLFPKSTLNSVVQQLREFVDTRGEHRNHAFETYHKRGLSSRKFVYEFLLANTREIAAAIQ